MATVRHGEFEWDDAKARLNIEKHGVTFEEAATVFDDLLAAYFADPVDPSRVIAIGHSSASRALVVVHVERGHATRIISARAAGRRERKAYEEIA